VPFTPHNRIVLSGYIGRNGEPIEQFSMGVSTGPADGGPLNGYLAEQVDDLASDVSAWIERPQTHWPSWYRPTSVKVTQVNADGSQGTIYGERRLPERPQNATGLGFPPQVCTVLSLNAATVSRRGKGRVFGPPPGDVSLNVLGLIGSGAAGDMAESFATLLQAINNNPGIDNNSNVVVVASTFGGLTPVTQVRVGQRLDTLRSRSRSIAEAYQSRPVGS
jgi:hypothetical protein